MKKKTLTSIVIAAVGTFCFIRVYGKRVAMILNSSEEVTALMIAAVIVCFLTLRFCFKDFMRRNPRQDMPFRKDLESNEDSD